VTWRSFMEFVTMLDLGQTDAIYRNYDIGNLNGSKPGVVLDRAYARMGFDQPNTPRPFVLPSIRAHMFNMGYQAPNDDELAALVRQWYNWDRIRKGDLIKWPMREVHNPLI